MAAQPGQAQVPAPAAVADQQQRRALAVAEPTEHADRLIGHVLDVLRLDVADAARVGAATQRAVEHDEVGAVVAADDLVLERRHPGVDGEVDRAGVVAGGRDVGVVSVAGRDVVAAGRARRDDARRTSAPVTDGRARRRTRRRPPRPRRTRRRAPDRRAAIHTRASIRRTPSTNRIRSRPLPGVGGIGAQSSSGRSTVASTRSVASARSSASIDEPYSGAHVSTLNRIRRRPARRVDDAPDLGHLEPHRHPLGELADVRHDGDHPAGRAELLDRTGDDVERRRVERAEALVEEDRLQLRRALGGQLARRVGEGEGERQRREERLAARQRPGAAQLVGVGVVADHHVAADRAPARTARSTARAAVHRRRR